MWQPSHYLHAMRYAVSLVTQSGAMRQKDNDSYNRLTCTLQFAFVANKALGEEIDSDSAAPSVNAGSARLSE